MEKVEPNQERWERSLHSDKEELKKKLHTNIHTYIQIETVNWRKKFVIFLLPRLYGTSAKLSQVEKEIKTQGLLLHGIHIRKSLERKSCRAFPYSSGLVWFLIFRFSFWFQAIEYY